MKVRALREFYGDHGEVRAGEEITVTRATGNELKTRRLVEIVDETEGEEDVKEAAKEKTAEKPKDKAAPAPVNKAQASSANKSAPSAEDK